MLSLFEVNSLEELADGITIPELEGFAENNVSRFHQVLIARLFDRKELPRDLLLGYDDNIVRHWKRITEKRNHFGHTLYPKYFQYLALLFAEIYLDRYFRNPEKLLHALNLHVEEFNQDKEPRDQVEPFTQKELNKVAFWMATGSGKTLLMHVNILQYRYYLALHGRERELNRIILLTPNEGLSRQHEEEFALSGIPAELFQKDGGGLFTTNNIQIIDIHKLREQSGEKTVDVKAFEGNNLVLVDEGHRGTAGKETGVWMDRRNDLCEVGFSFEYSATFGQAIKASGNKDLEQTYAKSILFDYSYKYFYGDGYGKDYRILNLQEDANNYRQRYLMACLLAFYQQQKLFQDKEREYAPFLLEKPLWIFVGGKVTAVRTEGGREVSDVVDILLFLAHFSAPRNREEVLTLIERFLAGDSGLLDARGNDLFSTAFSYLVKTRMDPEKLLEDVFAVLFNAKNPAALHVENLKGSDGEIALRLGDNEPFGVINVGDAPKLCKLCEEQRELVVGDREFSGSLFRGLNDRTSRVNLLVGSKKFSEGWSSWRVSTMGLMNIGKKEGAQIIQLFGRGVRLKGKDFCLKRTREALGRSAPSDIDKLETLNIFGVRADYMRQFKEYLEDEGLPSNEDRIEIVLPVIKNLGTQKLKTVRLKEGVDFKRQGPKPTLGLPDDHLKKYPIVLDWYPKIQAMVSGKGQMMPQQAQKKNNWIEEKHLAFMDMDAIYFAMQEFKYEKNLYNLNLSREEIAALLKSRDWYRLQIPEEEMELRTFEQVRQWHEIAVSLLKKYCDRYYNHKRAEYENKHLEYRELDENDPNFIDEYRCYIEKSREAIISSLNALKNMIQSGTLTDVEFHGFHSIMFGQHLYQPLLYVNNDLIDVKPVVLNEGERDFVIDLRKYYESNKPKFEKKELYLLRNMSRGRGIGFFEAGNFYPDFILWLVANGSQRINFIDPKGLRNVDGLNDPKIRFSQTIKELESRLGDPGVVLDSFIVSRTPFQQIAWWEEGLDKKQFEQHNVLFQWDDKTTYIEKLLNKAGLEEFLLASS